MERIRGIVEDWFACHPEGVVLRDCNLGHVINRVVSRADALTDPDARSRVYAFLAPAQNGSPQCIAGHEAMSTARRIARFKVSGLPDGVRDEVLYEALTDQLCIEGLYLDFDKLEIEVPWEEAHILRGVFQDVKVVLDARAAIVIHFEEVEKPNRSPLLEQNLHIDGGYKMSGMDDPVPVVHFLNFWRAFDDVCTAAGSTGDTEQPREVIAKEIASFRDGLLASHSAGTLTVGTLIEALVDARRRSVDQSAWAPLQAMVAKTAKATAETRSQTGQVNDVHAEHLPLDAVSMLVLPWLQDQLQDYLKGEKARQIETVSKTLCCEASAACAHLCAHHWNVETTLQRQRSFALEEVAEASSVACLELLMQPTTTEQDSLGLAKQPSVAEEDIEDDAKENECPICVQPYAKCNEQLLTKCCDQALCAHCAATLSTNHAELRCPFCRRVDRHPAINDGPDSSSYGPHSSPFDVFQAANGFARDASGFVNRLFGRSVEQDLASRPNVRLDVMFR